MEKVEFINPRGITISANFWPANKDAVIIMSHGFTGDKSEWGKFDTIAKELHSKGYAVLSYDFSGCGESGDDSITIAKELEDLSTAIRFVKALGYKNVGLFGHSLGGFISLKSYAPQIKTMVLTAPVTHSSENDWGERFTKEQQEQAKKTGLIIKTRTKGVRKKIVIGKELIKERNNINPKDYMHKINCPVLIIHGDKDEDIPLKHSELAMKQLPKGSKIEILKGADHGYEKQINKVATITTKWFLKQMKI
jgi:pimeloyl-ACP methyl ester carboxylesterase